MTVLAGLNHVGIRVDDLDAAIRFYAEGFGLERIAAPSFGPPVAWLRAGSLQLHLTETRTPQPSPGHFALEVDDFGAVYRWAVETGVLSQPADGYAVFELPGGECQMYLHDPSGNVVEVCHPDAARWTKEIAGLVRLADVYPQNADADRATLFSRSVSATTRT
jgi:catechol 2,3-dioxygenase-like lactoylglutathione lyase family enzyme